MSLFLPEEEEEEVSGKSSQTQRDVTRAPGSRPRGPHAETEVRSARDWPKATRRPGLAGGARAAGPRRGSLPGGRRRRPRRPGAARSLSPAVAMTTAPGGSRPRLLLRRPAGFLLRAAAAAGTRPGCGEAAGGGLGLACPGGPSRPGLALLTRRMGC